MYRKPVQKAIYRKPSTESHLHKTKALPKPQILFYNLIHLAHTCISHCQCISHWLHMSITMTMTMYLMAPFGHTPTVHHNAWAHLTVVHSSISVFETYFFPYIQFIYHSYRKYAFILRNGPNIQMTNFPNQSKCPLVWKHRK